MAATNNPAEILAIVQDVRASGTITAVNADSFSNIAAAAAIAALDNIPAGAHEHIKKRVRDCVREELGLPKS